MVFRIFFYLYVLYLPNTHKSRSDAVSSKLNEDNTYLIGSNMKTDRQMALNLFAAWTIFQNLTSFRIGKYVLRSNVIDNPCTKPCEKLPESMFISSTCGFQRHGVLFVFSDRVIFFSEIFGKWFNFVK